MNMKRKFSLIIILILSIFVISSSLSGCATSRTTAAAGTTGAIIGGATGFVIGALTGGPIGAIVGTAAGVAIGYGVGFVTGKYVVTREGGIRNLSMLNPPYRLASNKFVADPNNHFKINFKEIKGVLISNLRINTLPNIIKPNKYFKLIMAYYVLGTKKNIKRFPITESRILEGLNGKIYYSHTSYPNIIKEGKYKTQISVKTPPNFKHGVYIYEAIIKINNIITALSTKLLTVR